MAFAKHPLTNRKITYRYRYLELERKRGDLFASWKGLSSLQLLNVIYPSVMARARKSTKSGKGGGVPQKHLHSRISYLYQAAIYLDNVEANVSKIITCSPEGRITTSNTPKSAELAGSSDVAGPSKNIVCSVNLDESVTEVSNDHLQPQLEEQLRERASPQTHYLLTLMRSVSQKSQIRLSQSIKRSICHRCNGRLSTHSTAEIENLSRGGRKPWADVLVMKCCQCGYVKRYPVGIDDAASCRKKQRVDDAAETVDEKAGHPEWLVKP